MITPEIWEILQRPLNLPSYLGKRPESLTTEEIEQVKLDMEKRNAHRLLEQHKQNDNYSTIDNDLISS